MGYEGDVYSENEMEAWRALVHVCRCWRSVVFGSPRRLKLKLVCTTKIPVRDRLDLWPALPLVIDDDTKNVDNIIGLLKCSDRINQISLSGIYLEDISEAMEVPRSIPGADIFGGLPQGCNKASPSPFRFVLGWICPTTAIPQLESHFISGHTKATVVRHSPHRSSP